jgi:hypothetical protein
MQLVMFDIDGTLTESNDLNEFYGQRRFLTVDPNGCLIDICSPFSEVQK